MTGNVLIADDDERVVAIREVSLGGAVLSPPIASKVIKQFATGRIRRNLRTNDLSLRELEVLDLIYQGLRNLDIAVRLDISARTVETHVSNIMSKLGVEHRIEAIRVARELNLIK